MKTLLIGSLALLLLTGCNAVYDIPPGYVGKTLPPTGWSDDILEAGQINLGKVHGDGTSTSLVLLESTTTTVKEQFMGADESEDKQDHRVRTKNGMPLIVDIYVQIAIPTDKKTRNEIFTVVTPEKTDPRVSTI